MPFGFGRKNSEKSLNNTAAPVVAAPVAAAPLQGRSYELPAEPVAAAVLPGKTYEMPAEQPLAHHNPLDRNHDGRVDMNDLSGRQPGMTHANPLDRNHDGRVDMHDLSGQQSGMAHHNPLDRNHDGRVDARDLSANQGSASMYQDGAYIQNNKRSSIILQPTIIETIQKDVVIQERIHPVEKEEIQPIIYREREQLDVKQVTQMMHETQIQPTIIEQRELAAEIRAPIVERGAPIAENIVLATTQRDATLRTQVVHAPIVEEVIKKTVIHEVQPVLERDVFVPTVVQNTQPIYEKIVEAPTVYREVREVRELGTTNVMAPMVAPVVAPVVAREVIVEPVVVPAQLTVIPITTTTVVETYDHKLNPIETRDFVNNRGLPLR